MNIVIVGAGEVGSNVASTLASEGHDVNLVEQNEERANQAAAALDVRANAMTPPAGRSSRCTSPRYTSPGLLYFSLT